ncbi:GPO family capsid scaffolding protein [Sedimenticola hydrogenitrophicus]|uniref:GPO family capsid scaffolding protein n=1 Tax=Sedimenticola hydrogenitrophicus TaxID=2967975 RepID=UPI0023AF6FA1|nr:GPO family capsid scaffolding protein [Sedimenticola hydrogenitrophicus]
MKKRSKFFRVAQEGDTIDGRKITRQDINDAVSNFDSKRYGARVWLEHVRGYVPGGPFDALGDVYAVQAKEDDGVMGLYAQIEPLPELIAINQRAQKIYSSIELTFSKGKAWLTGLAVTDSPASFGTERLAFSAGSTLYHGPTMDDEHLYSVGLETEIEFVDSSDDDAGNKDGSGAGTPTLFTRVKALLGLHKKDTDNYLSDIDAAVMQIAESQQALIEGQPDPAAFTQMQTDYSELKTAHDALSQQFSDLKTQLQGEVAGQQFNRPAATGGTVHIQTDC